MYKLYKELHPDGVDYKTYKLVMYTHNETMIDTLLEGGVYSFGFGMGKFAVKLCKRVFKMDEHGNVKNAMCNFGATNKLRAAGNPKAIVYHTDPFFFKWQWFGSNIPNQSVWSIEPTDGPNGIGRKISKHVKSNPDAMNFYVRDRDKHKPTDR